MPNDAQLLPLSASARPDFNVIAEWVKPRSKVLDLGCGDGSLLRYLNDARQTTGYGVEIEDENILACVRNGVNVIQSDLERGLLGFNTDSFDYVILSQTLQAVRRTERIVREMLRVGREGIVTFPNFGYWRHRLQVLSGNMPKSSKLPYHWYDTPNVHLCTIDDFEAFCREHELRIIERVVMNDGSPVTALPNLLGDLAVYRFSAL
jgi:methionine biosynthesis protein MetW